MTGMHFLGRESNSHYHVQMACLKLACPSFSGPQLIVPPDVKAKLTPEQVPLPLSMHVANAMSVLHQQTFKLCKLLAI